MFLITVKIPENDNAFTILKYKVLEYENKSNRFTFFDSFTGLLKDFPSEWCSAEEVKA